MMRLFKKTYRYLMSRMGTTLLFLFLSISIIPLVLVGYYNYGRMQSTNFNAIQANLKIIVDIASDNIVHSLNKNIESINKKSEQEEFRTLLRKVNETILSKKISVSNYIGTTEWKGLYKNLWEDLSAEMRYKEYVDMYVLDREGNVLFTAKNLDDIGKNILIDRNESKLSLACKKALLTDQVVYSDIDFYPQGGETLSCFLVKAIKDSHNEKIGLVIYKIDLSETFQLIKTMGTGNNGHVYIVGEDLLLRSSSKFLSSSQILKQPVKTAMTNMWKQNLKDGGNRTYSFIYKDYRGVSVLGLHRAINIAGINFAVIAEINESEVLESVNWTRTMTVRIMIFTSIIVLFISIIIVRSIVRPIIQLSDWAKIASLGDFRQLDFPVPNNEIGDLRKIFSTLVSKMNDIATQARSISEGDYSLSIKPLSDRDQLVLAIKTMTESLQKFQMETKRQDWLKTGITELNEKMQGDLTLEDLTEKVIDFIAEYINIQLGAIYIRTGDNNFTLASTYAYEGKIGGTIKQGEGLIGQVAKDRKKIMLTTIPDDFYHIQTGTGRMLPKAVLIMPVIHEETVEAVLEIGSSDIIDELKIEFLEQIIESIAIAISSTQSRIKLRQLFKESQNQGQILKANEEELKKTNEELEEKTRSLELQKKEITDKNKALEIVQRDLEKKAEEIQRSSKYKSEFLANMSHELRTPLNSLLILSKDLADNKQKNLNEEQIESAQIVYNSGNDLLTLINEILDLSKIEAGKLSINIENVAIDEILNNIRVNFKHVVAEKGLDLYINSEVGIPVNIQTDSQRLIQIIKNLMSNAIKFTPEGSITVSVYKPDTQTVIKNSQLSPKEAIAISVTDTGIGIPLNKQQDIFEAFQQADGSTSRKYGGTGLGLSISLELTKLLGGIINLNSAEGCGSTFTIYLPEKTTYVPRADTDNRNQEVISYIVDYDVFDIEDDRRTMSENDKKILVVEDDNKFATILHRFCHKRNIKMIHASNGRSGIEYSNRYKPDAIILDIMLPEIDGWGVLKAIKSNSSTSNIPVYMITVEEEPKDIRSKDIVGYSTKPVNNEQLQKVFIELENAIIERIKKKDISMQDEIQFLNSHILLVDDDMRNVFALSKILTDRGAEVFKAANGQKALDILDETNDINIILMDIMMPVMDGYEAIKQIRMIDRYKNIPIIALTAKAMQEDRDKCLNAGASDYISKPIEAEKLMIIIKKWINK